jgi:hypothetical protein
MDVPARAGACGGSRTAMGGDVGAGRLRLVHGRMRRRPGDVLTLAALALAILAAAESMARVRAADVEAEFPALLAILKQGGFFPSWSDGTSWLEDHGSGGDGSEQFGREALEAFFPAQANSWYLLAWFWSDGSCDDQSGNAFGFSFAQQQQSMSVPLVVFGSL